MAVPGQPLSDWRPEKYLRFRGQRLQPVLDLLARIDLQNPAAILDAGCGPGSATAVLERRWPQAAVTAVDNSPAMLEKARGVSQRANWLKLDLGGDLSSLGMFDLVFCNAVLQWLPDNHKVIAGLFAMLKPGGVLAAQAPYARDLPMYRVLRRLSKRPRWRRYFTPPVMYPRHRPYAYYYDVISALSARVHIWQTTYIHAFADCRDVIEWNLGSGLRPFLERLPEGSCREGFMAEYSQALGAVYAPRKDGKVLLAMPRIFFLLYAP